MTFGQKSRKINSRLVNDFKVYSQDCQNITHFDREKLKWWGIVDLPPVRGNYQAHVIWWSCLPKIIYFGWESIRMSHWLQQMVDGDIFWISFKRLKVLSEASQTQLIKCSAPSTICWRQCDIRIPKWNGRQHHFFKNWPETLQTKWHQCLPKTIKLDKWLKSSWIFENAEVMACNWCFRKILGVLNMHFATFCHFLKFSGLPNTEIFGRSQRFSLSGLRLWSTKFFG